LLTHLSRNDERVMSGPEVKSACRHQRTTRAPDLVQCTIGAMGTLPFRVERCGSCQHRAPGGRLRIVERIREVAARLRALDGLARERRAVCREKCGGPLFCPACHCLLPLKRRVPSAKCPRGWWLASAAGSRPRLRVPCCPKAVRSATT